MQKIESDSIDVEIKNFFFLLRRGFSYAYSPILNGVEKNSYKINVILSKFNEFISRRLITYVFEKLIKETIDSVLKSCENSSDYLLSLEHFYIECKSLLRDC